MKNWLRKYLGINELKEHLRLAHYETARLNVIIQNMAVVQSAISSGLGRIITKLDPMFGAPEIDPQRKANSDEIGRKAIEKLVAEEKARMHIEGKL